jgi:exodeoxyribonuclease VII large subunit
MRHRHVAELTAALRREASVLLQRRRRRVDSLARALEGHRPQHRLARMRSDLTVLERRLADARLRQRHRLDARVRESAARLHSLSPLAVLGRGYAVCWNEDRTALVRRADALAPGDYVRVTLGEGELGCEVREVVTGPDARPGE